MIRRPLKPFQIEDGEHIAERKSALVAHEMRVGKTNVAIHAADLVNAKLVVVICPPNVKHNWRLAIEEFRTGQWTAIICGDNYAGMLYRKIKGRPIDVLIVDESQREKNRDSARTKAVWGPECNGFGGLIESAVRTYCLTGTPLPNQPMELWPMLRAIAPELILNDRGNPMSYSAFMSTYCTGHSNGFGYKIHGGKNYKRLRAALMGSGFCIRRLRKDVFGRDLQPPTTLYVSATKEYRADIAALEGSEEGKAIRSAIDKDGLAGLAKLEKNASKLRRLYGLAKVADVASIVSDELDAEPGSKIVIGAWHTDVLQAYALALRKYHPLIFDGNATPGRKIRMNKQFQEVPKYRVLLGQIGAAGVGLDLSQADNLLFAEQSFVGTDNEQFAARIFNMNNSQPKFVRFAVLPGSSDAYVGAECMRKLKIAEKIFG